MAGLGQPKTGGRVKGTPNKRTVALLERMAELRAQGLDCCPLQILMEFACGKKLTGEVIDVEHSIRLRASAELMTYLHPRLRSVEIAGADGATITFSVIADDPNVNTKR